MASHPWESRSRVPIRNDKIHFSRGLWTLLSYAYRLNPQEGDEMTGMKSMTVFRERTREKNYRKEIVPKNRIKSYSKLQ